MSSPTSAGAGAHELPAAQALTVYTELTVPAGFAAQGEELVLAGIAAGESDVATIRWTRVEGLLFPYWVLRLTGDSEAVPRQGLELLTANPAAGATYRTALSFDAATGALSLQVVDGDGPHESTPRASFGRGWRTPSPVPDQPAP